MRTCYGKCGDLAEDEEGGGINEQHPRVPRPNLLGVAPPAALRPTPCVLTCGSRFPPAPPWVPFQGGRHMAPGGRANWSRATRFRPGGALSHCPSWPGGPPCWLAQPVCPVGWWPAGSLGRDRRKAVWFGPASVPQLSLLEGPHVLPHPTPQLYGTFPRTGPFTGSKP